MKHTIRNLVCLLLCTAALSTVCTGCNSTKISAKNLMDDVSPFTIISDESPPKEFPAQMADFSLSLLRQIGKTSPEENRLLSPVSIEMALSLTANGAKDETLRQMEEVLGSNLDRLNLSMNCYREALSSEQPKVLLANSLWMKEENFSPNQDFLQTAADYYRPDVFSSPFDDSTVEDINHWVSDKTDGLISNALDEISPDAVLYLINTLLFDGKWAEPYREDQITDETFHKEDGKDTPIQLMYSEESRYLEHELATGFLKPYEGGEYAFGALLPREGMALDELLEQLDGNTLQEILQNASNTPVTAAVPKFSFDASAELKEPLIALGMTDAFSPENANLSGLGTAGGNLYISRVLHKTHIAVDEAGTRAGAVTAVEVEAEGAALEIKSVILNRPFLFFILHEETGTLLFLGTFSHPV